MKYIIISFLFGCASYGHALHASLDATAIAANAAGQATADLCLAKERWVLDRESSTYEQDQNDLVSIRVKCDQVFSVFEDLRQAHDVAVDLVESGEDADVAVANVVTLWARAQEAINGQRDSGTH